jgi:hypothetical protein
MNTYNNKFPGVSNLSLVAAAIIATCYYPTPAYAAQDDLRQKALKNPEFMKLIRKLNKSYQQEPVLVAENQSNASGAESTLVEQVSSDGTVSADQQGVGAQTADSGVSAEEGAVTAASESRFAVDEELIVTIKLKKFLLGEVFAIKSQQGLKVSFIGLMQALDFAIQTDLEQRVAMGWFIRETNNFRFTWPKDNSSAAKVVNNISEIELAPEQFIVREDDVYVEIAELQKWFGLNTEFNERDLELVFTSDTPLPVEERAARRENPLAKQKINKTAVLPYMESGYTAFSPPLLDAQLNIRGNKDKTVTAASVLGTHDMAYLTSQFYLSGDNDGGLNNSRLTLSKESANRDLLGPLKLTKFAFGDVTPTNIGNNATGSLSRGLTVSNRLKSQNALSRTVNIQGEVQAGWDIELYRNRLLVERKNNVTSGRYEFNDVELLYGPNEFEIILYGPQGQIEVRKENYDINELTSEPGEVLFDASMVELNKSLLNTLESAENREQGTYFSSRVGYGIADWWSVEAGLGSLNSTISENNTTMSLNNGFNLGSFALLGVGYQQDSQDRKTPSFDIRTSLLGYSLGAYYQEVSDPTNSLGTFGDSKRYRGDMSGQLFSGTSVPVSLQNTWDRYELTTGESLETFTNNLATSLGRFSFSNQLTWVNNSELAVSLRQLQDFLEGQNDPENLDNPVVQPPESFYSQNRDVYGSSQIRTSIGSAFVGIGMDYAVKPDYQVNQYNMNLIVPFTENVRSRFAIGYLPEEEAYSGQLSLNYRHDNFDINFDGSYYDSQWIAGINARVSFGYEPKTGQVFTSNRTISRAGAVAVKVFEDSNANQKHDKGERVIPDAKVKALQSRREAVANENGVALVKSLPVLRTTDVVIDVNSLDDPFLIQGVAGYSITPRAGYINVLELPVVKGGEVQGSVSVKYSTDAIEPIAYAPVELHDLSGATVATTQTEFDGYYLFSSVKPGRYVVRLNQSALKSKKVRTGTPLYLKYKGDGGLIDGANFVLEAKEKAEGFAVVLGEFATQSTLKAYWHIINKYGLKVALTRPFYLQNNESAKYELFAAFYQTEDRAIELCDSLTEEKIKCSVRAHNFDL